MEIPHFRLAQDRSQQELSFPLVGMERQGYDARSPDVDGVTLSWRDVSVSVVGRRSGFLGLGSVSYKRVVNGVFGAVKPRTLVALMGSSGAGKSTLMAALAHRNPPGVIVDGDIWVNGRPVDDFMHQMSGFMHQDDLFVSSLTVREHLNLMARLKLDRRTRSSTRNHKVGELLQHLGLADCAHTLIGEPGSKKVISGGERKRLAFATELLTDPPLLFCDEPTTGLDAFSAQKMVHMMRTLVVQGKTVVCTIHQPSSELFAMFDQLILLADGRVAFMGNSAAALEFFSRQGYECPATYNPADFFIHTLAVTPGAEETSRVAIKRICDHFAVSDAAHEVDLVVRLERHIGSTFDESIKMSPWGIHDYKSPRWYRKLFWLTWRSFLEIIRDPSVQGIRIIQKVAIAVMAGLCYVGTDPATQLGIQSVQGALFIFVTENTFSPMYATLSGFPQEMPLFHREYRSGLYQTHIYYISKMLSTLPGLVLEPVLFVLAAYWLVGLKSTTYAVLMTAFVTTLTMNVSTACGCFFATAFESVSMAMAYLVPFDYILMITSGLFIRLSTLPNVVGWLQYMSWLMYANEAMSIVQWEGVANISCASTLPDLPCLHDGDEILDKYSFSRDHLERNVVAMFMLYGIFHCLGFLCLWLKIRSK